MSFFLVTENSEHSGCWDDADGGDGCISWSWSSGGKYFTTLFLSDVQIVDNIM